MSKHRSLWSLLFCFAVILLWFSPWWIGGKVLAPLDLQNRMMSPWRGDNETDFAKNHIVSDSVDQYLVYRLIAERSFREEGWIGWSSLTYGGTAEYANTMALYFDWTMQLHRWLDFWTAWHLGLMGQVMLAAGGMWCFLRGRSISHVWACCAALAYAANSQFVTWIYHRWALSSFCWVPWILWAADGYRNGRRGFWALVPLFIAMAFLGGTLQHGALVALAVVAVWGEELLGIGRQPGRQLALLGRYATWGLLGAGLAGMMLLPCIDAFLTSNRLGLHIGMYGNADQGIYRQGWLQPLLNLAAYPFQIFPSLLGRCDSIDVLKLFKSELFYVAYFGSLPVLLAFLAMWRKDSPTLARLLIATGLLLPLTPLARILYQRLFLLFVLGGLLAFVNFMDRAERETRIRIFRTSAIISGIGFACWFLLSLTLYFQPHLTAKMREKIASSGSGSSFGYFSEWLGIRANHFIQDLFIWSPQQSLPLLLLGTGLLAFYWTASKCANRRRQGALLAAAVVVAEVTLFAARWVVWSDPGKDPMFAKGIESTALDEHVGREGRVTTLIHPTAHMAKTPFIPNTLAAYDIATITGYDSIVPDGMLLPNESPGDAHRLGRLGVTHLITWAGNGEIPQGWKKQWESGTMDLYRNETAMPRYAGFKSQDELGSFHAGGDTRPAALIETTGEENRRSIVLAGGLNVVRIAENSAKGWEFRVDGTSHWQDVQRGPDGCMQILLPDSDQERTVSLRYRPPLKAQGLILSAASLVFLILAGITIPRLGPNRECTSAS